MFATRLRKIGLIMLGLIVPLIAMVFGAVFITSSRGLAFMALEVGMFYGLALLVVGAICVFTRGVRLLGGAMLLSGSAMGLGSAAVLAMGAAWGRPLRVRGQQLHPELRQGADWTRGATPDVTGLQAAERAALEALWLHDAQKEHASVPAFSRISWLLAAVGAPAELMEGAHAAALQEIEHARLCFALAAGYGGRSHTVEAMPDLLLSSMADEVRDPVFVLVKESVLDGCLLEDFNADVARACQQACKDPAVEAVLRRISEDERQHAEFSWSLVAWLLQTHPGPARRAVEEATQEIPKFPRPTPVCSAAVEPMKHADPAALRHHGRLPDSEWERLWALRQQQTQARIAMLMEPDRLALRERAAPECA